MRDPILFALAVVAVLATPGPTNALLATAGATAGTKRAIPLIFAEALGYALAVSLLGAVLGPALARAPMAALGLRVLVASYLLWVAVRLWLDGPRFSSTASVMITFRQVLIATTLNPKSLLFAFGIIPFGTSQAASYFALFVVLVLVSGAGWVLIGSTVGAVAGRQGSIALVPRVGAVVVGSFALALLAKPFLL